MSNQIKKKFIDGAVFTEIQGNINTGVQSAKDYADSQDLLKLAEAKAYADQVKSDLLNGAGPALDTLKELGDLLASDGNAIAALTTSIGVVDGKVDQEILDRAVAVQGAKDYADAQIAAIPAFDATALQNADNALAGRLDVLEPKVSTLEGEMVAVQGDVAAKLVEAKAYTDSQIAAIPAVDLTPYLKKDGSVVMTGDLNMAEVGQGGVAQNKIVKFTFPTLNNWQSELGNYELLINGTNYGAPINDMLADWAAPNGDGTYTVAGSTLASYFTIPVIPGFTLSFVDENLFVEGGSDFTVSASYPQIGIAPTPVVMQSFAAGAGAEVNHKIKGLAEGTDAKDAVTKGQLDAGVLESKNYADAAVLVEKNRAEGAEGVLAGRLDVVEPKVTTLEGQMLAAQSDISSLQAGLAQEIIDRANADDAKLVEAKAYTDAQIAAIPPVDLSAKADISYVDSQDAAKLVEAKNYADTQDAAKLVEAKAYTDAQIAAIPNYDASALIAADVALNGRLDIVEPKVTTLEGKVATLEGLTFVKEKIVVGATLTHVELANEAKPNSCIVFVDRLALHQDEDFTVSVVGGKTRLTWAGEFMVGGTEAVETGYPIYITYYK